MNIQARLAEICSVIGKHRTFLLGRSTLYQPCAGMKKQSLEQKLGIPEKPKRPTTPYFRFMSEVRPSLVKNNPQLKVTEISKLVGSQWEKLDPAKKQQLGEEFRKEKTAFDLAITKYKNKLSEEDKIKLEAAKKEIQMKREKSKLKNRMREMGKPKRPASAYLFFAKEKLAERAGASIADWRKNTADSWAALSNKEKEVYLKKQTAAQEAYKRDMKKWEERMIRLGNIDLVRNEALIERVPKSKNVTTLRKK